MLKDISGWGGRPLQAVPIGKRVKSLMYNPLNGDEFYFKEPESKFPWEFWTEVIASRIGRQLGFNTLSYEPVIYGNKAGCLSPSMVKKHQDLIHGQRHLIQLLPNFEKKKGTDHSFQMVEQVFSTPPLSHLMEEFIMMLCFDAVIGNHDRHQQNWAVIRTLNVTFKDEQTKRRESIIEKMARKFMKWLDKSQGTAGPVMEKLLDIDSFTEIITFSPLFDNGNCMGYNFLEENISGYLSNEDRMNNYLFGNKACCHLKWEKEDIKYIDLLEKVSINYKAEVKKGVKLIRANFNENLIEQIIYNADQDFPDSHNHYMLTLSRKKLMFKIVQKRVEQLLSRL